MTPAPPSPVAPSPETDDWMPVRISREVAATLFVRDKDGRRLTWEWGKPDADGFYTPTVTTSEDDWYLELAEARQQGREGIDVERLTAELREINDRLADIEATNRLLARVSLKESDDQPLD